MLALAFGTSCFRFIFSEVQICVLLFDVRLFFLSEVTVNGEIVSKNSICTEDVLLVVLA